MTSGMRGPNPSDSHPFDHVNPASDGHQSNNKQVYDGTTNASCPLKKNDQPKRLVVVNQRRLLV